MIETTYIVVLNDGETFTGADGCSVFEVDGSASTEDIEQALKDYRYELDTAGCIVLGDGPIFRLAAQFQDDELVEMD